MKLPLALQPYVSLIKWGLIGLLSAFLFVSGCNYGQSKHEATIVRLEQDKALLQEANASWAAAARERNAIIEDNVKESERLQREAEKGAKDLADSREGTTQVIGSNSRKLQEAVRDPKCNELLEMMVCPTVPLP